MLIAELCLNIRELLETTIAVGVKSDSARKAWLNNTPVMRTVNGGRSTSGSPGSTNT